VIESPAMQLRSGEVITVPLLGIILFTISGRGGFKAAGSEAQHAAQRAARARARAAAG
jgi:hypothetical protein